MLKIYDKFKEFLSKLGSKKGSGKGVSLDNLLDDLFGGSNDRISKARPVKQKDYSFLLGDKKTKKRNMDFITGGKQKDTSFLTGNNSRDYSALIGDKK